MTETQSKSSEVNLLEFKSNIVTLFEELWALRGNDPIAGRLYAFIILSEKPLTQRELEQASGYSRGQVSKTLKFLEHALLINKSSQIGSREKNYHTGSESFLKTFAERMKTGLGFLRQKLELLDDGITVWKELPVSIQNTAEAQRIRDVGMMFRTYYTFYLGTMDEVIEKVEREVEKLEKELKTKI